MKKNIIGERTVEKISALADFLENKYQISLFRAISISKSKLDRILLGEIKPSKSILARIAAYFCISISVLCDDDKDLPPFEMLNIDENLVSIQRNDAENEIERLKHKHFFARNWRVIGYKKRIRLILSILLVSLPLAIYIIFCGYTVANEKIEKLTDYREGSDESCIYDKYSKKQVSYFEELQTTSKEENPDNTYYVEVKVGTILEKMKNISTAASSYDVRMQVYFKFDKDEFRQMFRHYARNVLADQIINDYYEDNTEEVREELFDYNKWLDEHQSYFEAWVDKHDSEYYPIGKNSNKMFDIGNGEFVADSYAVLKELEEVQYYDNLGNLRTLCYQKVKFNGHFEKSFDSVRYPLDSVQFKMYIKPVMDANYIRYVPDRDVNSSGERLSGFTPYFSLEGGYRLLKETKDIKNFVLRINYYYAQNNDPAIDFDHTIKTQLEVIVRANRAGISLFLKAFINLFSVVVWIIIAFYSQSHTGEDSIGMLGTGLFGVISSMLVGLSMVSDAGKMANVRKDRAMVAYNAIKLRILFYVLLICTIIMFFVIPCLSYMWTL